MLGPAVLLNHTQVRAIARRIGVSRLASRWLRRLSGASTSFGVQYEVRFSNELLNAVSVGNCVWDIGANIGHFTKQITDRVGERGSVIAFGPFGSTCEILRAEVQRYPQVRCLQLALGAEDKRVRVAGEPGSPSNNLFRGASGEGEEIEITTATRPISLLRDLGFKTSWLDAYHLKAHRNPVAA